MRYESIRFDLEQKRETLYMVLHEDCHFTSIQRTQSCHIYPPAQIWEIKEVSGFLCFVLSGGLLFLHLLLSQWLRQQFLEVLIHKLLL